MPRETATWVVVSLCVLQVQTLYYSADHKLLDRAVLDGQVEVFGAEEDHIQFVQVHTPTSQTGIGLEEAGPRADFAWLWAKPNG